MDIETVKLIIWFCIGIGLILAPFAIWSECRQIRKALKEQTATKNVWQECYNIRKKLDTVIALLEGGETVEEPR